VIAIGNGWISDFCICRQGILKLGNLILQCITLCIQRSKFPLQIGDLLGYGMLIFQNHPLWCCVSAYSLYQLSIIIYDTNQSPNKKAESSIGEGSQD